MQYIIKEPIYRSHILLTKEEAFKLAKKFSCNFPKVYEDQERGIIELNVTYMFSFVFYYIWIKKIVIRIEKISTNTSNISVFGIPAILPHNILFWLSFVKKKIDLNLFTGTLQSFFREYEIKPQISPSGEGSTWWFDVVFIFLEISAFSLTVALFFYVRNMKAEENGIALIFLVLLYIFLQISLIIWFSRDCYSRTFSRYKSKQRWLIFIGLTGFIGCFFYYVLVFRSEKNSNSNQE